MKLRLPGLLEERAPNGRIRWRVRVEGDKRKRLTLPVSPDSPDFLDHYHAARRGISLTAAETPAQAERPQSVGWLSRLYEEFMDAQVEAGLMSPLTRADRRRLLRRLRATHGRLRADLPPAAIYEIRDGLAATPSTADNMLKTMRAMFTWAKRRGLVAADPTREVERLNVYRGGAKSWTIDDLRQFRDAHPPGGTARLALALFAFTACRIGDAIWLGEDQVEQDGEIRWLSWRPRKRGSAFVSIPMAPPLIEAIGDRRGVFIRTAHGEPHRSAEGLRNRMRKWCDKAGLEGLSAHGIRKAAGELLAAEGCTQYQVMAIHGHTNAATSEIYTRRVERRRLALEGMRALEGLKW